MISNLIIGAGQLGSRHLQGMLKYNKHQQRIFVVDPNIHSLEIAKNRADEIQNHNHTIFFETDLTNVPLILDLVIVATQANIREKIINSILGKFTINYLILEKVLFQKIESLYNVKNLINRSDVKVFVNHPRRMFKDYNDLKSHPAFKFDNKIITITGNNWGLGCNGIHFIDLITYLTNSQVEEIKNNWLDNEIHESSRSSNIEFTGALSGRLKNGDYFIINSKNAPSSNVLINICYDNQQLILIETTEKKINSDSFNLKNIEIKEIEIDFQSNLTTQICEKILNEGTPPNLTPYDESIISHQLFLDSLINFKNHINNSKDNFIEIT
jgi:hypothetical protein